MRPTRFQGNVHILNFPASTEAAELAELFDAFGIVLGAQIKTVSSASGTIRMGIVAVAPDAAADAAIVALQGHKMGNSKIRLVRAKAPPKRPAKSAAQRARSGLTETPAPAPAERYPAKAAGAEPRKVIVEYRGRRSHTTRLISLTGPE